MAGTYRIAAIPGDNIGPEVTQEALRVLGAVAQRFGFSAEVQLLPWGAGYFLEQGVAMPSDGIATLRQFDAIFMGAHGDPARVPDSVSSRGMMHPIRQQLDLFVNLRPCILHRPNLSPLAQPGDIDFVVVRENTEGEYVGAGGRAHAGTTGEVAIQTTIVTRAGCERVIRFAFELARQRDGKKYVHAVTKSNALAHVMTLWDDVFARVAQEYPDIRTGRSHVDAMAMFLVGRPSEFDVVVATNLFGDILSDLGAQVTGSIGLAASANLNPARTGPSMFEPVHGSAPDIAGQNAANPLAAIGAMSMLLDWVGEADAGWAISDAIAGVLSDGQVLTRDLGGTATTTDMTDALLIRLAAE
ncbi:MAG: 3-isopropylmalate dehydrogenase [Chloroflexi bacterium]|nr:3-isopropylmalate dehydrogenase [Chloroflexota bacterium]